MGVYRDSFFKKNEKKEYYKNNNENREFDKSNYDSSKTKKMLDAYNTKDYVRSYNIRYFETQYEKYNIIKSDLFFIKNKDKQEILDSNQLEKDILLDYGCGTGLLWDYLLMDEIITEKIKNYNFIGIDLAIEMLKDFKRKIENNSSQSQNRIIPQLICAEGENLPFRNDVFNKISALTSIQNLANPEKGLREIIRTSKKGATCGISILKKSISIKEFKKMLEKINKIYGIKFNKKLIFEQKIKEHSQDLGGFFNRKSIEDWAGIIKIV